MDMKRTFRLDTESRHLIRKILAHADSLKNAKHSICRWQPKGQASLDVSFGLQPSNVEDEEPHLAVVSTAGLLTHGIDSLRAELFERTAYIWPAFVSLLLHTFYENYPSWKAATLSYQRAAHTRSEVLKSLWGTRDSHDMVSAYLRSRVGGTSKSKLTYENDLPPMTMDVELWQRGQPTTDWTWDGTFHSTTGELRAFHQQTPVLTAKETVAIPHCYAFDQFQKDVRVKGANGSFIGDRNILLTATVTHPIAHYQGYKARTHCLGVRVDPVSFATVSIDYGTVDTWEFLMTYFGQKRLIEKALAAT